RVLAVYERARQWIQANTSAAAQILSEEAKVSLEVALLQLKVRTDFTQPQPGTQHIQALQAASPILLDEALVRPGTNVQKVITDLVDT
ncbi:aliphatic sulfonates ABC transporter substrate-binding protein, partial [Staphylococcus aureus]